MSQDTFGPEPFKCKLRRYYAKLFVSKAKRLAVYEKIMSEVWDYLQLYPDLQLRMASDYLVLQERNDAKHVVAIFSIDSTSRQAVLIVDEEVDIYKAGQGVKQLLDARNYYLYYQNMPMMYYQGAIAIGPESIKTLQAHLKTTTRKDTPHDFLN